MLKMKGPEHVCPDPGFRRCLGNFLPQVRFGRVFGPGRLWGGQRPNEGNQQSEKPETVRRGAVQSITGPGRLWTNKWVAQRVGRAANPNRATLYFTHILFLWPPSPTTGTITDTAPPGVRRDTRGGPGRGPGFRPSDFGLRQNGSARLPEHSLPTCRLRKRACQCHIQ